MIDYNYILLFFPLIIGLLLSIITLKVQKSGQFIDILSSSLTGIAATYFFLMIIFTSFDAPLVTLMTMYHPLNNENIVKT